MVAGSFFSVCLRSLVSVYVLLCRACAVTCSHFFQNGDVAQGPVQVIQLKLPFFFSFLLFFESKMSMLDAVAVWMYLRSTSCHHHRHHKMQGLWCCCRFLFFSMKMFLSTVVICVSQCRVCVVTGSHSSVCQRFCLQYSSIIP